jgi:hypothetical protein
MGNVGDERRMIQTTKPPYQAGGWQRNIAVVLKFCSTYVVVFTSGGIPLVHQLSGKTLETLAKA